MERFTSLTIVGYIVYITSLIVLIFTNNKIDSVICLGIAIMCQCWDNKNRLIEINKKINT